MSWDDYCQYYGGDSETGSLYGSDIASAVNLSLDEPMAAYLDRHLVPHYESLGEIEELYLAETEAWRSKPVKHWTSMDITHWINSVARELDVCCTKLAGEKFGKLLDGYQLLSMSEYEFQIRDKVYGSYLYNRLQDILSSKYNPMYSFREDNYDFVSKTEEPIITSLDTQDSSNSSQYFPKLEDTEEEDEEELSQGPTTPPPPPPPVKKRPGRPKGSKRKKPTEKLGRLWEFLRDLLKNRDFCPSLIVWENHDEGMFRFVHSDKVAKLWGSKKENPDMNYEKLSRAMRYYYKNKVLMPVYGRRLVYKFGPNATNWRVKNPNFIEP